MRGSTKREVESTGNPEGNSQSSANSTPAHIPPLELGRDAETTNANLQLQHFFYHVALRAEKVTPLDQDTVLKEYYDANLISFSGGMKWDEFIRSISNQQDLDQDTVASSSASPDTQKQEQQQQFIRQAKRAMDSTARALGHSDPSLYTSQKREPSVEKLQASGLKKLNLAVDPKSNKITMPRKLGAKATFELYLQNRSKISMNDPGARPTYTIKRKNKEAMVKELLENIANGKIDRNLVIVIDNQKYDCNKNDDMTKLVTKFQNSKSVKKLCHRVKSLPPVDINKSVSDSRLVVEKKYAAAPPMILALQGLHKETKKLNVQLDPLNPNGQQQCQELQKRLKAYDEMCKKNPDARNQLTTEEQAKVSKLRAVLLLKAPLIGNDAGSKRCRELVKAVEAYNHKIPMPEIDGGEKPKDNPHQKYLKRPKLFGDGSPVIENHNPRYRELYALYNCGAVNKPPSKSVFFCRNDVLSAADEDRRDNNTRCFEASQKAYENDGMDASGLSKTGMVNLAKRLDISAVTPKTEALAVIDAQLELIPEKSPDGEENVDYKKLKSLQTFIMEEPKQYYQLCLAMAVTDNKKPSIPFTSSPLKQYEKALDAHIEEKGKEIAEQEIEELTTADTTERQELAALKIAKNKAEYAINHPAPPEDAFKSTVEQAEEIVEKIKQLQVDIDLEVEALAPITADNKLVKQLADLVEINQLEQPEGADLLSGLDLKDNIKSMVQAVRNSRTVEPVETTEELTFASVGPDNAGAPPRPTSLPNPTPAKGSSNFSSVIQRLQSALRLVEKRTVAVQPKEIELQERTPTSPAQQKKQI